MRGPRGSLLARILTTALANLALLGIGLAIFLDLQLREGLEGFLLATARDRLHETAAEMQEDLATARRQYWTTILGNYSARRGVTYLLLNGRDSTLLAGPATEIPPEVADRIRRAPGPGGPPFGFGPGGPPAGPPPWLTEGGPGPFGMGPPPWMTGAAGPPEGIRQRLQDLFPTPAPFLVTTESPRRYWIGQRMLITSAQPQEFVPVTLLLTSRNFWTNPFYFPLAQWLGVGLAVLALSLLCWLPLVRGLTRSVRDMQLATARIADGQFDVHIEIERSDELGQLAHGINRMAGRLQGYVRGQKRFLGDVAHELRTPLARMQVALGVVEQRTGGASASYIADLADEVEMMGRLTDELLSFAKAELRPEAARLSPTAVAAVLERAVATERTEGATIRVHADAGLRVMADPEYLFRAVSNLVRNAVRYAGTAGPIDITAERSQDRVRITVADAGPGVPADELEHLLTPFYRLDSSRDRRSGGTGLGLAIVQSCVEACHGRVTCRNRQPHGLAVTIDLPAVG